MKEMIDFLLIMLSILIGMFGGIIAMEYALYLLGRKNTLFHESWKTILR